MRSRLLLFVVPNHNWMARSWGRPVNRYLRQVGLSALWKTGLLILCCCSLPEGPTVKIDSVNGVKRILNQPPPETKLLHTASNRLFSIDGAPNSPFVQIWDAVSDTAGRLFVVDAGLKRILMYDAEGRYVRAIGSEGEGPGEFRWPARAAVGADTLWVWDLANRRLSGFLPSGELANDITLPHIRTVSAIAWSPTSHLVAQVGPFWTSPPGSDDGVVRLMTLLTGDTILRWEDRESSVVSTRPGMSSVVAIPFRPKPIWAIAPDGTISWSDGKEYRILQYDARGRLLQTIERKVRPVPVSRGELDSIHRELDAVTEEVRNRIVIPETKAAISQILISASGDLWVNIPESRTSPPTQRWDVFASDGVLRFFVRLPPTIRVRGIARSYVFGVERDSLDQEHIVAVRLLASIPP